jgi:hypothetical protein
MDNTFGVFRAAYIIAAVVYAGYALTIWLRAKRIRERLGQVNRQLGETADGPSR